MNQDHFKSFGTYLVLTVVGIVVLFVAAFLPETMSGIKNALAVFGGACSLGYVLMIWRNIYKPLKEKENK